MDFHPFDDYKKVPWEIIIINYIIKSEWHYEQLNKVMQFQIKYNYIFFEFFESILKNLQINKPRQFLELILLIS